MSRVARRLARDESGATIVEFAIVVPVMVLMLMGGFDIAHQAYATAVLTGTVEKAGRDSTLETSATAAAGVAMDQAILASVRGITGSRATHQADRDYYSDFSNVGQPERYVDAPPNNGRHDGTECFEDENGNGQWDADMKRTGQGGADDVALYTVTITYPRLFPMAGMLGWPASQTISATTVLRNQPYRNQQRPVVVRCP